MNKFRTWYLTYWNEITWFIIGWLAMATIEAISRGQWTTAAIDAVLLFINYKLSQR